MGAGEYDVRRVVFEERTRLIGASVRDHVQSGRSIEHAHKRIAHVLLIGEEDAQLSGARVVRHGITAVA